jgi:phage-related protein
MQQERRFDAQEPGRPNPNPDLNRQEMVTMDRFLDQNPSINKDLRGNPSLVNNAEYLEAHPQLQAFLSQHPTVRDEIAENPRFFMQQERRFDAQEPARRPGPVNPDVTNQEVVTLDRFLDRHQDIAKSLEKKPELVNERGYLKHHRDLDEFLTEHPAVREELKENPASFMRRENRLEARTMNRDLDRDVPARDGVGDRDRDRDTRDLDSDVTQKEVRDMDHFLDKHKSIDKDLQKKPALVNDRDYLKRHKSLQAFLEKNPHVESEIRQNPSAFMDKERLEARNHRLNNHKPVPKPKTKVEEKEQMHTATPH